MPLYRGRTTAAAATAIARMESAGAILIGKLRQTEGTLNGYHRDDPVPMSPWRSDHWPGASSSGSGIALAARMIPAALSSDTGGSIRTPSALCGVTGLMPSKGLVSIAGAFPVAPSLDRLGPMARSARDCAMVLNAIAGFHEITSGRILLDGEILCSAEKPKAEPGSDRIVVFLTKDRGKKRGVAKGARRPRSRFTGALEPMTRAGVAYYERELRDLVRINYVEPQCSPLLAAGRGRLLGSLKRVVRR